MLLANPSEMERFRGLYWDLQIVVLLDTLIFMHPNYTIPKRVIIAVINSMQGQSYLLPVAELPQRRSGATKTTKLRKL